MLPEYWYPNHKHTLLVQDTQYSCYQEIFRPWSPISKQSYNGASLVYTHVRRHANLASRKNIQECGHRKPPSVSAFRFSLNLKTKIMFLSRGLQTKDTQSDKTRVEPSLLLQGSASCALLCSSSGTAGDLPESTGVSLLPIPAPCLALSYK